MPDLPPPTPAGKLLRRTREMAVPKLSRPDVAHSAGIDPGTLGNIERGYRHLGEGRVREVPGEADVIAKVARVLKIPPGRLESEGQRPDAAEILREILAQPDGPRLSPVPDPAPALDLATANDALIGAFIGAWPDGTTDQERKFAEGLRRTWELYTVVGVDRDKVVNALEALLHRGVPRRILAERAAREQDRETSLTSP